MAEHDKAGAKVQKLDDIKRHDLKVAATNLQHTFVWAETVEGYDYWDKLYQRLMTASKTGYI